MRLLVLLVLVKGDEVDDTYSMTVVVVIVFVDIVDDDGADFFSKGQYC